MRGVSGSREAQRVLSELWYLEFCAGRIGKAIGFSTPLVAVVENPPEGVVTSRGLLL